MRRTWVRQLPDGAHVPLPTDELTEFQALCCLGNGGLGKTWEIDKLAEKERNSGRLVAEVLLARYNSVDALRAILRSSLAAVSPSGAIYLDGLDELMTPLRVAASVICEWICDDLQSSPAVALRISCRSGVWPKDLLQAIYRTNQSERVGICELQPLDGEQIALAVASHHLDPAAFLRAVRDKGCLVLAQQPLTLRLLIRMFASHSDLPGSRRELFEKAVVRLLQDPAERTERGTSLNMPLDELIEVAERLAVLMALSGRDVVDMNDEPMDGNSLGITELAQLPRAGRVLDSNTLWTLANTALMQGRGMRQHGFFHRQIVEHLAGRRLARLPAFQAIGFLASDAGRERGVAGPLREVAAVAATYRDEIARWIAETDPEILGISEVADDRLRKLALSGLFEKFRRNELTDSQISRDVISFNGLNYPTVAEDVVKVLTERTTHSEDVHAFAIALCEAWQLTTVVPQLVSCTFDKSLPLATRVAAAAGVANLGTSAQRQQLMPLIVGGDDDESDDLKGIALAENWPERITPGELFSVLTPPKDDRYLGHYGVFIYSLDHSAFDGAPDLVAALTWARNILQRSSLADRVQALMRRIVLAAISNASNHDVVKALAAFVSHASQSSATPLFGGEQDRIELIRALDTPVRREILSCLMAQRDDAKSVWAYDEQLPGILNVEDFPWLLAHACDSGLTVHARTWAASLASWLNWQERREFVDLWLTAHFEGAIPEPLNAPLASDLSSEQIAALRAGFKKRKHQRRPRRAQTRLPTLSVEAMLDRCERLDPAWFAPLSRELAVAPGTSEHRFERFLTRTHGWSASDAATRRRIVSAARVYLDKPNEFLKRIKAAQANEILNDGGMAALFLLLSELPDWLESRTPQWWTIWAPYILRELHSQLSGEPEEPKQRLIALLHQRAPDAVRNEVLSTAQDARRSSAFSGLCRLLIPIEDRVLDEQLTDAVIDGRSVFEAVTSVANFLLRRGSKSFTRLMDHVLQSSASGHEGNDARVRVSVSALSADPEKFHKQVYALLRCRPDLATSILARYAHDDRRNGAQWANLGAAASGELLELLFNAFPPEADPVRTGAYWVSAQDSAISLRGSLIAQLARHADAGTASKVFARLEAKFQSRYPWLRRPRAEAERRLLLTSWAPLPPRAIAETLANNRRHLLRSPADVLGAIRFAVEQYEWTLQRKVPPDIQDLWNIPRQYKASPKDEEVVSDKLLAAIEATFKGLTVVASREVQLFRRLRSGDRERPGTRVDLMLRLPASGTPTDEKITVMIEVKRSCNAEAKTGLRNQLVDLYLVPQGYTYGAFVVAYLNTQSQLADSHRPVWKTIEDARADLKRQVAEVADEFSNEVVVEGLVLDARLPSAIPPRSTRARPRRHAPKITANRSRQR